MISLWAATAVLYAVVAVLAWAVAKGRPGHRAIAYLLTVGWAMDVARKVIQVKMRSSVHPVWRPPGPGKSPERARQSRLIP